MARDPVDIGSPEQWRWIWLVAAVAFGIGEMALVGSFFLAPFAVGAVVAAVMAFAGVDVTIEWAAFVAVSGSAFLALRPLARRLDAAGPVQGIGSHRQIGQRAQVLEAIDGEHEHGLVMLGGERWRAESLDGGPIAIGVTVVVEEVRGTRLLVRSVPDTTTHPLAPPDQP